MFGLRRYRPVLCLLLAVSTAIGSAPLLFAKSCICPAPSAIPLAQQPIATVGPAVSCCGESATCCAMKCCGESVQPQTAQLAHSCVCPTCECQSPVAPKPADSVPPPPPVDSSSLVFASAPPAPPEFLSVPNTTIPRLGEVESGPPPIDLITVLSRLTC